MDEYPLHPWYPWFDAFRAACKRFVDETEKQNQDPPALVAYLSVVEQAFALQPTRPVHLDRLMILPSDEVTT